MSHAYTEDQRVEQPAIGLFAELGNRNAEHRPGTMENLSRPAEAVLGAPVLQRS